MSKNQAPGPQKPALAQNLLIFAVIFLAFNLFMNRGGSQDTRTPEEIMAKMVTLNKEIRDVSIAQEFHAYTGRIAKLPQPEKDQKELQAAILVTDTQLKAGILRDDLNRLNAAYTTIHPYEMRLKLKPEWSSTVVKVADESGDKNLGWNQWTPQALYDRTVSVLSERNKNTPVWGFFPGYQLIDLLVHATGANPGFSYAFAAFLLAVAVRAVLYPLSQKQYMYSRQMQQLQPLIKEVQEKYKDKPMEIQSKTMEIYKEYGLNPAAGCFPMFLQLPLIFLVYQCMLHYRFEFQKGTFLWISPAGHAALPNLIASNLGHKDLILLTLYGISMVATSFLTPVADPSQAKQQRLFSVSISAFFAVMMFFWPDLPSAFVLYWTITNILTTLQSLLVYRTPLQPLVKVNTPTGGVYPTGPTNGHSNGKPKGPISSGPIKTGTPAKHKPKKRK